MVIHSIKNEGKIINKLLDIKFPRIMDLINYFKIEDIHSYFEVFQLVFAEIERLNYNPEILNV